MNRINITGTMYPSIEVYELLSPHEPITYPKVELTKDFKYLITKDFKVRVRGFDSYFNKHELVKITKCIIEYKADRWNIVLFAKVNFALDDSKDIDIEIGVDVGTTTLAVTSLGEEMELRPLSKYRDRIEKVKTSLLTNPQNISTQTELERLERRVKNIQMDAIHKHSYRLSRYKNIIVEDLKLNFYEIRNFIDMIGGERDRRNFSFDILKQSWAILFRQCKYKVGMKGGFVEAVPHFKTSQKCCLCFNVDKRSRKGKFYHCRKCKSKIDSDWNAGVNILALGRVNNSSVRASYVMLKNVYGNSINPKYYIKRLKQYE